MQTSLMSAVQHHAMSTAAPFHQTILDTSWDLSHPVDELLICPASMQTSMLLTFKAT